VAIDSTQVLTALTRSLMLSAGSEA
jgi:hypothetical protein